MPVPDISVYEIEFLYVKCEAFSRYYSANNEAWAGLQPLLLRLRARW